MLETPRRGPAWAGVGRRGPAWAMQFIIIITEVFQLPTDNRGPPLIIGGAQFLINTEVFQLGDPPLLIGDPR